MAPILLLLYFILQIHQVLTQAPTHHAYDPTNNNDPATLLSLFPPCTIPCIIVTQEFTVRLPPPFLLLSLTAPPALPSPQPNLPMPPPFRTRTAACEALTCSPPDYRHSQASQAAICAPIYHHHHPLGTSNSNSISSAISSATSAALSALSTATASNPLTYPPCAQTCLATALTLACTSFSNTSCVCQNGTYLAELGACENTTCDEADLEKALALAEVYCLAPGVGGIGDKESQLRALNETLGRGGDGVADLVRLNATLQAPRRDASKGVAGTGYHTPHRVATEFGHGPGSDSGAYTRPG